MASNRPWKDRPKVGPKVEMEEQLATTTLTGVAEWMDAFGPIAVLVLLTMPLGEELILIPAGMMIGNGLLPLTMTWICAYIGIQISDCFWFAVARLYGPRLLQHRWFRRFVHPRRLLQAKHQIEARGAWVMVTARFIPGSRTAAIIMAGMLHMQLWKFLLPQLTVSIISLSYQLFLGYLVALGIGTQDLATKIVTMVGVVVLIIAALVVMRIWFAARRGGAPAARARIAWLNRFRGRRARFSVRRKMIEPDTDAPPPSESA